MSDSQLTICHVIFSDGFAGSERSTIESCNQQVKSHKVYLIVKKNHRKKNKSIVDYVDENVEVIELPKKFFLTSELRKMLNAINPDLIHCHLRRATRLVAKINPNAATVSTLHIAVNSSYFYSMDGIICNAQWQVDSISNGYSGLVLKANNSLTPHRRLSHHEKRNLRCSLNLDEHDLIIGAVGRLSNSKGWDTLISAYKLVSEKKKSKVVFFGNGSLEKKLKKIASEEDRIQFRGFQDNIKDIYQIFDLLVCPSRFEPLPRVMLEAYDAGIPIFASRTGGCAELIDLYGGKSFEVGNIRQLQELLTDFINKPYEGDRPNLEEHHIESTNKAMVDFYRKCIVASLE